MFDVQQLWRPPCQHHYSIKTLVDKDGLPGDLVAVCARTYLELDDPFLGQAEVHPVRVFQVEGTLVELGHGVVGVH